MDASTRPTPSPPAEPADAALVRRAAGGDRAAFDLLVERHQRRAVAVAYRLLGNRDDALEVTQAAFLKAYRSVGTLQTPEAFTGWLLRIVSNLSLNYRRGRSLRRGEALPDDDAFAEGGSAASDWLGAGADPTRGIEGRELGEALARALQRLSEKQRAALVLFTIEGRPQKEIAETLGCSVEAVKWHVFQGRKRLRELLKDHL